ncbi:SGNH/GDSL hydrolase family protein [Psychroserpens sp.]|uniref:SGNH/GDSL hydrolase family protein n=1 Tax=Psychroserpens sp. TaxID=2020870 RepID=UPI003C74F9B0
MKTILYSFLILILFASCSSDDPSDMDMSTQDTEDTNTPDPDDDDDPEPLQIYKILSLGDSYTIGQSVCNTCRFPEQLNDSLTHIISNSNIISTVIAQTGWTTTDLQIGIASETLTTDYELVTLLIGVNNQFQNAPFSIYETEFPQLVETAIMAANGDKSNLIVLSIPDYAFTPFGQNNGNPVETSQEIDVYNTFIETYCSQENISFLNITDITRMGLEDPSLVAADGLHPSQSAYTKFVERLLPLALEKIL